MAATFVINKGQSLGANGGATGAIDTSTADFIALFVGWYYAVTADVTISDSKSNTYSSLTKRINGTGGNAGRWFYTAGVPTVGGSHTFSATGTSTFPSICVLAFKGMTTSSFDVEATTFANATTIQPGNVTPSVDNELLLSGVSIVTTITTCTIDLSFTKTDFTDYAAGSVIGSAAAYLIETTATAKNPTWTAGASANLAGCNATFKSAVVSALFNFRTLLGVGV